MSKVLFAVIAGLVAFSGAAQAETVALKAKYQYDNKTGASIIFSTKACGIKSIFFTVEGKQISYFRFNKVVASYQTPTQWGVIRDNFDRYGMVMAGETSPTFELRAEHPCLRRIYLEGDASLWPTTQMKITFYGNK